MQARSAGLNSCAEMITTRDSTTAPMKRVFMMWFVLLMILVLKLFIIIFVVNSIDPAMKCMQDSGTYM